MNELFEKWEEIKESIKQDLGMFDMSYNTWIRPLKLAEITNNICYISIPDSMGEDGLEFYTSKYGKFFKAYIQAIAGSQYDIRFIMESNGHDTVKNNFERVSSYYNDDSELLSSLKSHSNNNDTVIKTTKANLNPKYTFDNFVVGGNNNVARSAALAVTENPGNIYNPLFIWGGSGYGKTHLMHAIGHELLKKYPEKNIMYVTSETFTNEVIDTLRSGDQGVISKFRDKYRNLDLLLFDDVQFLEGKDATQEEFFHTFNELHASGKAIIITSDKPPKNLTTLADRIKSRFNWGITVDIGAPDYETRVAILRKNAELNKNIDISDEIIQYLATKVHSNVRELEGALNSVILHHKMKKEAVMTTQTVDEAIKDIISPDDNKEITIPYIINVVSDYFDIEESKILSTQRDQKTADVRMIIMYLCYEIITNSSKAEIGKALNRNHATVIHGIDKIKQLIETDENLYNQINEIRKIINNG